MQYDWLIVDANNVAARNFFGLPAMYHLKKRTEAVFGLLRDVLSYRKEFNTDNIALCFDDGECLRTKILPTYKESRKQTDEFLVAVGRDKKYLRKQLRRLKKDILPAIGLRNLFWEPGYEADDVIASLCKYSLGTHTALVISGDRDLYQLLRGRVDVYDPRTERIHTVKSFVAEYGVQPQQWAEVKAIAGCDGDDVPGVKGVGEKTAIKFLQGKLKIDSAAMIKIKKAWGMFDRNMRLVHLPLNGCPEFKLRPEKFKPDKWRAVLKDLGMTSIKV
jgi:5'-3' exonuclease